MRILWLVLTAAVALISPTISAAPTNAGVGNSAQPTVKPYVLSTLPRMSPEVAQQLFQPLAKYLSEAIGKPVVFEFTKSWGVYLSSMKEGKYDIVFDGAQFTGYRVAKLNYSVLAKFPSARELYIFVRTEDKVANAEGLVSQTICTQVPPNLDGLVAIMPFKDATQQPLIVPIKGRENIYKSVLQGHCRAGVLPAPDWNELDKSGKTRIVFKSPAINDQAISAGPRLSPQDQAKLAAALVAPGAAEPTKGIRTRWRGGDSFVPATNAEYAVFASLLKGQWDGYFE